MCSTVWEQVLPLNRKDIRNNMSAGEGGEGGSRIQGDEEEGWGEEGGGLSGKRGNERRNTLDFAFSQQVPSLCPLPHSSPPPPPPLPPTSVKCPSSTISALQRGATTNSASLTSHNKHSCLSAFLMSSTSSRHCIIPDVKMLFGTDTLLWEGVV